MIGRQGKPATRAVYVAGAAALGTFFAVGAVAGQVNAQPDPVLPTIPAPAPPPIGAPPVPPVPADQQFQPGQLGSIGDIFNGFRNPSDMMPVLFPEPAVPPTPVREMPMGPPPPLDPRFLPPPTETPSP